MADSYATISLIANTPKFLERLYACAAQQGAGDPNNWWVYERRYQIAASPSWAEKVDSWLAANPDGGDGWAHDQAVISDGDILAVIQPLVSPPPPSP